MLLRKTDSLEWLEFELFQEFSELKHGVFLHPFQDFECQILSLMGCEKFVKGKQVHGIHVERFFHDGREVECDGLVTNVEEMGLLIQHGDCQSVILYDPFEKAIANIHAGWRGNVQNIYKHALAKMKQEFSSKPENIFVGISPSLGPCCAQFIHFEKEIPSKFWTFQTKPLYFNLWEMAKSQLIDEGILAHHIEIAPICTMCSDERLYSYRKNKTHLRNGTVVSLEKR